MAKTTVFEVLDERALDAMVHPVRRKLLALLRTDGPATATRLAERIGESSGVTSYHLRKLADVGMVEEDRERGTKRERWWRARHKVTTWSPATFLGNPQAHQATVSLRREIYRWQWRLLEDFMTEETTWDKAWVEAAGNSDYLLTMTPESLQRMNAEIWDVVQRYAADPPPDDAPDVARVVWLQHTVPTRGELPL